MITFDLNANTAKGTRLKNCEATNSRNCSTTEQCYNIQGQRVGKEADDFLEV
uniref:Uncharacterized protein n=1 Tax=Arundo donax TaxID=35708 RepID=A0A0A9AHB5_ARUDO